MSQLSAATISEFIESIYAGADEQSPWTTFLQHLKRLMDANITSIVLRFPSERDRGTLFASTDDAARLAQYRSELYRFGTYADWPMPDLTTLEDLVAPEQWPTLDLYRYCLQPLDMHHLIGVDCFMDGEVQARVAAGRAEHKGRFTAQEREWLRLAQSHLARAIRQYRQMQELTLETALYAQVPDRLGVASILLDASAVILRENPLATSLLQQSQQFPQPLLRQQSRLVFADEGVQLRFRAALEQIVRQSRYSVEIVCQAFTLGSLQVLIKSAASDGSRKGNWFSGGYPVAVVLIGTGEARMPARDVLRQLFGFTEAETTLALLLAQDFSVDEAAAKLGVTRNTANTHVKALFVKCGVSRQASLVRLLATSIAALA
jgi:DNA-binding CsgD family transcriptional regulator